ncbi:MAG: FHA domain-containing protein [Gammaproteobacteria bacterium]
MAKLIVKLETEVIDHIELRQGDMKIGRRPGCDVFLDNLAVSGEHANIFTIGEDSFIQDLNSTNGTFINNKRITKHHLRNGDSIAIGKYSIVYMTERAPEREDFAKTVVISPVAAAPKPATDATPVRTIPTGPQQATLLILSGANNGKRIELTKTVTNLGRTGKRAGTITNTADGYLLAGGTDAGEQPKLNGRVVGTEAARLRNGDIIEVAGTRLQFHLK